MNLIEPHQVIETILGRYSAELGDQAVLYRNHVYRGFNLQLEIAHLEASDELAVAWAAHDLGLWTQRTLHYLGPSVRLAEEIAPEFNVDPSFPLRLMIEFHHCLHPLSNRLAESFELADRADAWPRHWRGPLAMEDIDRVVTAFSYCGFQGFLGRAAMRYALTHPWNPFPMFRWGPPARA